MVALVARRGRQMQRYSKTSGGRLVVGCIPYKITEDESNHNDKGGTAPTVKVLVISSQKGDGILFPKGGWEKDETMKQAATREAFEEAGVRGNIGGELGRWRYKSRRHGTVNEGIMFPLLVTDVLVNWPEMNFRKRQWVSVVEAKKGCPHAWMREALDRLVKRLSRVSARKKQSLANSSKSSTFSEK